MKIVYEGYYGFKNTGDDAFVEVASWGANYFWNCPNNYFIGNYLPKTTHPFRSQQTFSTLKGLDRFKMLANLLNADFLISAGGSTFSEIPMHSNKALAQKLSTILKTKLGAIGVSIGPFSNTKNEKDVVKYLKSLKFLALRDKESYDYTLSLNLPYEPVRAFDLAALLPDIYNFERQYNFTLKNSKETLTVGLSICNYERYKGGDLKKEEKRNIFFEELIVLLKNNLNVHFKVFIINAHEKLGDLEPTKKLLRNIPEKNFTIINYHPEIKKTWDEICACDCMISTRLHGAIFACYAQIPFFLIEYHRKCADFLNDVGQDEKYRFYDAGISPEEAYQIVAQTLQGNYKKPTNIEGTKKLAAKNFTETLPKLT